MSTSVHQTSYRPQVVLQASSSTPNMESPADKELRPFYIRNIESAQDPVSINAFIYDATLSSNRHAALRYDDEDGDVVTV